MCHEVFAERSYKVETGFTEGVVNVRIAYQGEPGAYSEAAALRFDSSAELLPRQAFEDVFHAVQEGTSTHGILPIENTIAGSIHRNYDLMLEYQLPIVAEVKQPVVHNLIVCLLYTSPSPRD